MASDDDLNLALKFLRGTFSEQQRNNRWRVRHRLLTGEEEKTAREALARILLGDEPVPLKLRGALAYTINPEIRPKIKNTLVPGTTWLLDSIAEQDRPEVKLVPKTRTHRNRPREDVNKALIAVHVLIRRMEGFSLPDAFEEVAKEFGYKDSTTVRKYWYERREDHLDILKHLSTEGKK